MNPLGNTKFVFRWTTFTQENIFVFAGQNTGYCFTYNMDEKQETLCLYALRL